MKQAAPTSSGATLTGPSGMGGINGTKGYDFQTRYIISILPALLGDTTFASLVNEGAGDVDVRFGDTRMHVQVKDYPITAGELRAIVEVFVEFERTKPGVYGSYKIAAPSVNAQVNPIFASLGRIRGMLGFYDTVVGVSLEQEKSELKERLEELQLSHHFDFILGKLHFDPTPLLHDAATSSSLLIAGLQKLSSFRDHTRRVLEPCHDALFGFLSANRGKTLERLHIENVIHANIQRSAIATSAYLDFHGWCVERYEPPAEHALDWTPHFDREKRRVPSGKTCDQVLLPELKAFEKKLKAATTGRRFELRGKMSLTTALAVGATFPETAGWVLTVQQPQMPAPWSSNAARSRNYPMNITEEDGDAKSDSIAFIFSVTNPVNAEVKAYLQGAAINCKAIVMVEPESWAGSLSISSAEEAVSLALAARDCLFRSLKKTGVRHTHLFYCGPVGLAVLIGQKLTSVHRVDLYEYQPPGYVRTFRLQT